MLLELEPAPEGVLLPGLELPPLPASPPEPGNAVPLVLAPFVPAGSEGFLASDELLPDEGPLMLLPFEVSPEVLVAAMSGIDSAQVRLAIAKA